MTTGTTISPASIPPSACGWGEGNESNITAAPVAEAPPSGSAISTAPVTEGSLENLSTPPLSRRHSLSALSANATSSLKHRPASPHNFNSSAPLNRRNSVSSSDLGLAQLVDEPKDCDKAAADPSENRPAPSSSGSCATSVSDRSFSALDATRQQYDYAEDNWGDDNDAELGDTSTLRPTNEPALSSPEERTPGIEPKMSFLQRLYQALVNAPAQLVTYLISCWTSIFSHDKTSQPTENTALFA